MAKGRPGRPPKLTPQAQERICRALGKGLSRKVAATLGGVKYKTFRMWERKGERQRRGAYRDFCAAVELADAEYEEFLAGIVYKAADPHTERTRVVKTGPLGYKQTTRKMDVFEWRAALECLQRRRSADWGLKETAAIAKLEAEVEELRKVVMAQKAKESK